MTPQMNGILHTALQKEIVQYLHSHKKNGLVNLVHAE